MNNKRHLTLFSLSLLIILSGCKEETIESSTPFIAGSSGSVGNQPKNQYIETETIDSTPVHIDGSKFSPPPRVRGLPRQSQSGRKKYTPLVNQVARQYGVDPILVHAVISQESQYRPRPSPVGARGLMQVMPDTGRRFGCNNVTSQPCNIRAGIRYLKHLSKKFAGRGNIQTIAAGYNAGGHVAESYLTGKTLRGKNPKGRKTQFGVPVASFGLHRKSCPGKNYNPSPQCEGETYKYARNVAGFYLRYKKNPSVLKVGNPTKRYSSQRRKRRGG